MTMVLVTLNAWDDTDVFDSAYEAKSECDAGLGRAMKDAGVVVLLVYEHARFRMCPLSMPLSSSPAALPSLTSSNSALTPPLHRFYSHRGIRVKT